MSALVVRCLRSARGPLGVLALLGPLGVLAGCSAATPPQLATTAEALCAPPDGPTPTATERLFDDHAAPRLFQITIAPGDLAYLDDDPRREEYVPATVELEGERFERAGIRYKGAYGSLFACFDEQDTLICDKLSLKVSFNKFVDGGRFMGVRKLVFNSAQRDPSYLHERLAYALFRAAGVPASRVVHARVSINGGPESLFVLVESVDDEWIEDRFEDDGGNLYKEVWPQHVQAAPYLSALRTNERTGDVSRMVQFAQALALADEGDLEPAIATWMDSDELLRHFVVDQVVQNWDGIWKFYCWGESCGNHNFYIYDDPGAGLLRVIPWDLDFTFNRPNYDLGRSWLDPAPCLPPPNTRSWERLPQCDPILRGLMRSSWERYRQTYRTLVAAGGPLSESAILELLDRYRAMIGPHVAADPAGPSMRRWREEVARLRQVIRETARASRQFVVEGEQ